MFDDLLELMHAQRVDYTACFRALAGSLRGDPAFLAALFDESATLAVWTDRWHARLAVERRDRSLVADEMDRENPLYIPRNHVVEAVLDAGTNGDVAPFHELLAVVTNPYRQRDGWERFAVPAPEAFGKQFQTFCGT
jgi:serine/tyrosine/threonine adenylyltransferase